MSDSVFCDSVFCEPSCEEMAYHDEYREAFYELIPAPHWLSSPIIREARRKARESAIEEARLDRESHWATDCEYAGF